MNNSYRIKANVGKDQVLKVNLKQDVDIYEILSLQLDVTKGNSESRDSVYKLHYSDYGVIVGRVLANDAFGVPNAKVSVFIPLSDADSKRSSIDQLKAIYPYKFVTDYNSKNVKYNTLPNYPNNDDCYQVVGSFPKKLLVLDDDSVLEVYDKYYKYTTITNKSGDYMIFGVPVGEQIIHVDVDLSDIGILSQKPRDFIYKGYSIDMFESPTQFKKGTDLDNLAQIHNESTSLTVYPFWGDKNSNEIAITRKDINLQYKFETTCVFLGSVITDNETNSVSHNCIPDPNIGEAGQLTTSEGTIEMIRKTVDNTVEEFSIKGNQLIDGDGVFCYQIPMNLDYVGMDEYGNICPTDNPSKGIPTRARVRFRFTLNESGKDTLTRHKARLLVPNNPPLYQGYTRPTIEKKILDEDAFYEFGSLTPDECFRDLYWNKAYSVKAYIPRLQVSKHEKTLNYLAIKGVNKKDARKNNPIPFNKMNLNLTVPSYKILQDMGFGLKGISGLWRFLRTNSVVYNSDTLKEQVIEEMDGIGLDFYNDWINGCLYFPLWFWHIRQKKKYKKGESVYESMFCECKRTNDEDQYDLYVYNNFSLYYDNAEFEMPAHRTKYSYFNNMFNGITFGTKKIESGIIKKKTNKDGAEVYYYSFGNPLKDRRTTLGNTRYDNSLPEGMRPAEGTEYYYYARLFSTDIILLGSLNECDINGVPAVSYSFPSTTANIPYIGRYKHDVKGETQPKEVRDDQPLYEEDDMEENVIAYNGMNWGSYWHGDIASRTTDDTDTKMYKYQYGSGLFFGLYAGHVRVFEGLIDWTTGLELTAGDDLSAGQRFLVDMFGKNKLVILPRTTEKSCINAERICELGVTFDSEYSFDREINGNPYKFVSEMDGLITKRELEDIDTRALFATLNTNKLVGMIDDVTTGYKNYNLTYCYPTNFDGRLENIAIEYTSGNTFDDRNPDYIAFRMGTANGLDVESVTQSTTTGRGKHIHLPSYDENTDTTRRGTRRALDEREVEGHQPYQPTTETYIVNDNGDIVHSIYEPPKIPHFYGYERDVDDVYPLWKNRGKFSDYEFTFPLYENSFYFFFGLNIGSTAIDKFYNQFYTPCPIDKSDKFTVRLAFTSSTECNKNGGSLAVFVENIDMPYSVDVYDKNNLRVKYENGITKNSIEFDGMANGEYSVVIKDNLGNEIEETINIAYNPVVLNTTVVNNLLDKYIDTLVCGDSSGVLEFTSVLLYDNTIILRDNVSVQFVTESETDDEVVLKINGVNELANIRFRLFNPRDLDGYSLKFRENGEEEIICSFYQNRINIGRPVIFDIETYELCNGEKSNNISYNTVTIGDADDIELYINNTPATALIGQRGRAVYNSLFYNGNTVSDVTDIKGWFGINDPGNYSDAFYNALEFDENGNIVGPSSSKNLWKRELGKDATNLDVIETKVEWVFNLAKGAYVTADSEKSFYYDASSTKNYPILLRTASPVYSAFSETNIEQSNDFNTYVTSENRKVVCSTSSPNIVSENYKYVDDNTDYPQQGTTISGEYNFNPKYKASTNKAGNYVAAFSNGASLYTNEFNSCDRSEEYFKKIPVDTHDLYNDYVMCTDGVKNDILPKVYEGIDETTTNRYIRTEFIDRRFDFDFVFVTACEQVDYISPDPPVPPVQECECTDLSIDRIPDGAVNNGRSRGLLRATASGDDFWKLGRISAITYNGIEMLYNDDKKILSNRDSSDKTEYKYDLENCLVELNNTDAKRFYESSLKCGNVINMDLRDAYVYNARPAANAKAVYKPENGGTEVQIYSLNSIQALDTYYNNISTNEGYPSKRSLNINYIPYSENYKYKTVSCSYENLNITEQGGGLAAFAQPGESVEFDIEAGKWVTIQTESFERYYAFDNKDIEFRGAINSQFTSSRVNPFTFKISVNPVDMYDTKIEKVAFLIDGDNHANMKNLKTGTTNIDTFFANSTNVPENVLDTSNTFKSYVFKAPVGSPSSYITILIDRHYYSRYRDSLSKNIRVINASTTFDTTKFNCKLTGKQVLSSSTVTHVEATTQNNITIDNVNVNVNVTSIHGSGTAQVGEETGTATITSGGGSGTGSGNGSGTNNIVIRDGTGIKETDSTTFTIESKFITDNIEDICFKISFGGVVANYTMSSGEVELSKGSESVTAKVNWMNHTKLLRDGGDATVKVYMKISNGLVYGFDFTMNKNTSVVR